MGLKRFNLESLINTVWRCFISLKLTFFLLGIISLGAVLGMSFDQTKTFEEYQQLADGSITTRLVSFFELYDAFHSWWFSLAILLLSLNLLACSIERLPRIYFDFIRPRPYLTRRRMLGLNLLQETRVSSTQEAIRLVSQFLPARLDKARMTEHPGFYYAERHGLGRFGVYIVHIALLTIMFSSIYATQNGVDGHVLIEEGQKSRFISARGPSGVSYNYDLGFYVGCDDFRLRTFIDNSPMEYESDLTITLGDELIAKKTVRVNEPLSYAGFTFYQSSFRPVISERVVDLEVSGNDGYKNHTRVRLNQPINLPNGDVLLVQKVYEDFAGLGQAIRVSQTSPDQSSSYFHVFRRYKDYDQIVRADQFSVAFVGADQHYATGLSVGKVPGVSVIFFGFLLLMVGLYMCFFMNPMRFFARIEQGDEGVSVWFAAQGFRHQHLVKETFYKRLPYKVGS
jgi:cytochrome c biogenesis protein